MNHNQDAETLRSIHEYQGGVTRCKRLRNSTRLKGFTSSVNPCPAPPS
jgi:hypothetical protein